jgi:hypothetical protein
VTVPNDTKAVDVLAVMDQAIACVHPGVSPQHAEWHLRLRTARATVAELIDCVGDAQSLLAEIDSAVRAEHAKNGSPKSQSVAGVINLRLTDALARSQGKSS